MKYIVKQNTNYCIALLLLVLSFNLNTFAQVGVNTEDPHATLDITNATNGTSPEGLLVPRLTGNEIEAMTTSASLSNIHNGLLVFSTKASNALTPIITSTGFWYYDAVDSTWKILEREERRESVIINPDGTGDYRSLQAAYDEEAKKKYVPTTGNAPVEFICTNGNVGDLRTDGSIPQIKITGGASNPSIGNMEVFNCNISFAGDINAGDMNFINSYVNLPNGGLNSFVAKEVNLKKCLLDINTVEITIKVSKLILDQSSGNSTGKVYITFEPSAKSDCGLYMNYSSLKMGLSSIFTFSGGNEFTNYIYCDNASLLNMQGTIKAEAPVTTAVVYSALGAKASLGTINGTAIPDNVFYATNGGRIEHFRNSINMTTKGSAFYATNSGDIFLGSGGILTTESTLTKDSSSGAATALNADGGNIRITTDVSANYNLVDYNYALIASSGGKIITLSKIQLVGSTLLSTMTPGVVNTTNGSVIYHY